MRKPPDKSNPGTDSNPLSTRSVTGGLWMVLALALASLGCAHKRPVQAGVMVWDAPCLSDVSKGASTRLVAPLKPDGTPDIKKAWVEQTHVTFSPSCGRIEVRK